MLKNFIISLTVFFLTIGLTNFKYANAQSVTFKFNPPDGYTEMQTTESIKELYIDGEKKITDENISKTQTTYNSFEDGYKIINTIKSVESKRNGKVVSSKINDLLLNRDVTLTVDKNGSIKKIEGYENLLDEIQKVISPKMLDVFKQILDPELIMEKTTTEWNGRITDYIGKEIKNGDTWASVSEYKLKSNKLMFLIATEFSKVSPDSVRIDFSYSSDKETLNKVFNEVKSIIFDDNPVLDEVTKGVLIADFERNTSSITGNGYRILDPRTMLIKEENLNRTISTTFKSKDGEEHSSKRTEKRIYNYEEVKK